MTEPARPPPRRRRRVPKMRKQYISTVDARTTMVCLDAAGQIRNLDEPFETLAGPYQSPPTHVNCRAVMAPYAAGIVDEQRTAANAEIQRRPAKEKRKGPEGYEGPVPPPPPVDVAPQVLRPRPGPPAPVARVSAQHVDTITGWRSDVARVKRARSRPGDDSTDPALGEILATQGFDGPPRVVTPTQLSRVEAAGGVRVWRGITGPDAATYGEEFRTGQLHVGVGIYGNGTYTTTDSDTAATFAGPSGVVLAMALQSDARIITWAELEELLKATIDALTAEQQRRMAVLLSDPGRFAAAMGYDAVLLPNGEYLVLNRTALVVAR